MIHINSLVDPLDLASAEAKRFVMRRPHPSDDLFILNYSKLAQFKPEAMFDPAVKVSRGLIVDSDGFVHARPFTRFFNLSDYSRASVSASVPPLPVDQSFEVFDKLDGSLGILYQSSTGPALATRGSFDSEQAVWATNYYREHFANQVIPDGQTYLFEIIYHSNRVVVDYDFEGLVLLAVIDNTTGLDLPLPVWPGRVVASHHYDKLEQLRAFEGANPTGSANSEGYVVRFSGGTRVKVKFGEYVRLHKIMTNLTNMDVFEHTATDQLRDLDAKALGFILGTSPEHAARLLEYPHAVDALAGQLPDEMHEPLRAEVERTVTEANALLGRIETAFTPLMELPRKDAAQWIKANPSELTPYLLTRLSGRAPRSQVWREIRPRSTEPFV